MKKYILIGEASGIGGWQIYGDGRVAFLKKMGVEVYVITSVTFNSEIKLQYFKECHLLRCNHVFHRFTGYPLRDIKKISNDILSFIDYKKEDEVFIEATSINSSLWAEYLSKATQGVSFCYLLHSHIEDVSVQEKKFFWFKYNQHLLAGMTYLTLQDLFQNFKILDKDNSFAFKADGRSPINDENTLLEETNKIESLKSENYKIVGYFGTLNKPHVIPLCKRLHDFFTLHSADKFLLILIGSSTKGEVEKVITNMYCGRVEVKCIIIPELFPVPRKVFELMDVCIGSWGCARNAASTGVKTIRLMGDTDIIAQGIVGITLRNKTYYDLPAGEEQLEDYLDNILYKKAYDGIVSNAETSFPDYELMQHKINNFIHLFDRDPKQHNYYEVEKIGCLSKLDYIHKFMFCIIGIELGEKILMLLKKYHNGFAKK